MGTKETPPSSSEKSASKPAAGKEGSVRMLNPVEQAEKERSQRITALVASLTENAQSVKDIRGSPAEANLRSLLYETERKVLQDWDQLHREYYDDFNDQGYVEFLPYSGDHKVLVSIGDGGTFKLTGAYGSFEFSISKSGEISFKDSPRLQKEEAKRQSDLKDRERRLSTLANGVSVRISVVGDQTQYTFAEVVNGHTLSLNFINGAIDHPVAAEPATLTEEEMCYVAGQTLSLANDFLKQVLPTVKKSNIATQLQWKPYKDHKDAPFFVKNGRIGFYGEKPIPGIGIKIKDERLVGDVRNSKLAPLIVELLNTQFVTPNSAQAIFTKKGELK